MMAYKVKIIGNIRVTNSADLDVQLMPFKQENFLTSELGVGWCRVTHVKDFFWDGALFSASSYFLFLIPSFMRFTSMP